MPDMLVLVGHCQIGIRYTVSSIRWGDICLPSLYIRCDPAGIIVISLGGCPLPPPPRPLLLRLPLLDAVLRLLRDPLLVHARLLVFLRH